MMVHNGMEYIMVHREYVMAHMSYICVHIYIHIYILVNRPCIIVQTAKYFMAHQGYIIVHRDNII